MDKKEWFLKALRGGALDLDDWLECNTEKEIRDVLIPIIEQRDELLAAMKKIRPFIDEGEVPQCFWSEPFKSAVADFDAAIAKCEA